MHATWVVGPLCLTRAGGREVSVGVRGSRVHLCVCVGRWWAMRR